MGKNEAGVSLRTLANMLYLQKLNSAKRQDKYKEDQTVYLKKKNHRVNEKYFHVC